MTRRTTIKSSDDRVEGTLTRLLLRRFKAFEFQAIQLAPITIIVGPNNSGKSAVLSSLRILQQTLQSIDPEVPLALGGFGTYKDVIYGNKPAASLGLAVELQHETTGYTCDLTFNYRAQRRQIIQQSFKLFDGPSNPVLETAYSKDTERQVIRHFMDLPRKDLETLQIRFDHFVPRLIALSSQYRKEHSESNPADRLRKAERALANTVQKLTSIQYLGPSRDMPLRVYSFSGERPSVLTATGGGATDLLVADYTRRGTGKRRLAQEVENWLIKAKVAAQVAIQPISDRHYELKFEHPITGELENYADVGFGVSQILPVLVAGYNLEPGSVFMVEQPEIHLHPSAQSELGDFVLDLYERRIQTLIETHSEHLIMRLQRHVASGVIPPEHVAVNYVYAAEGQKVITRLPMNQDGIFVDKWPQGFFEERLGEALELARAPLRRKGELE